VWDAVDRKTKEKVEAGRREMGDNTERREEMERKKERRRARKRFQVNPSTEVAEATGQ